MASCASRVLRQLLLITFAFLDLTLSSDYTGYKVYRVITSEPLQNEILHKLEGQRGYDFWNNPRSNISKIMVAPYVQEEFKDILDAIGITNAVVVEDVEKYLKEYRNETISGRRSSFDNQNITKGNFNFDRFPRYSEIVQFMKKLIKKHKYGQLISIGTTFENRPIFGIRIGTSDTNPVIFIDAGIHAREWAAPVTALYLVKKILQHEDLLAKKITFYIIPCLNPDGYEYTHTNDRFWRKTRSANNIWRCPGVDVNRNFDSHWAEVGTESEPCSGIYPGYEPFSELESKALRDAILQVKPVMYLTFHSYGPFILYPWGFTSDLPENWKELDDLAHAAAAALKKVNGQDYAIGSSTNILYSASGGSDDWAMQKANVPLVYTIELPQYGKDFEMPVEKIKPMVKETYEAFLVFVRYVCEKYCN